ncbi:hypothetical protein G4B88_012767 [Cannabis sativa]|uniref:Uncharacterized protein n=1 Tax=Cannabis sativa TaxID=3483 RepID=A0A7J6GA87_CANSA|nr:hypothetical protein G4B88_012767 [Cannabis sativa]
MIPPSISFHFQPLIAFHDSFKEPWMAALPNAIDSRWIHGKRVVEWEQKRIRAIETILYTPSRKKAQIVREISGKLIFAYLHQEELKLIFAALTLFSAIAKCIQRSLPFSNLILYVDAAELYEEKHPLSLCTDDVGVFSTSLSGEYKLAASAFGTSNENYMNHRPANMNFLLCLRLFWHFCTYRFLN